MSPVQALKVFESLFGSMQSKGYTRGQMKSAASALNTFRAMVHTEEDWEPIETAPKVDGTPILAFRPLAHLTNDPHIRVVQTRSHNNSCWPKTVPEGCEKVNYTSGACYASHWMPLPKPPLPIAKSVGAL